MLGRPVKIFMSDWMSQERVHLIESYSAGSVSVSKKDGGLLGSIRMCEEFAASRKEVFFSNGANVEAHAETSTDIVRAPALSFRTKRDFPHSGD
jgi:cysteine synthase A